MPQPANEHHARAPIVLWKTDPAYTSEARRAGVEGRVNLSATVGVDGRAFEIGVVRGLDGGLDRQAVKAVRKWQFAPAVSGDRPVPCCVTIAVEFRLPAQKNQTTSSPTRLALRHNRPR